MKPIKLQLGDYVRGQDCAGKTFEGPVQSLPGPFSFTLKDGKFTPLSLATEVTRNGKTIYQRGGRGDQRRKPA